jgi:phosphoribosyl 1,2-cyclic phosphate phosphodiesterase
MKITFLGTSGANAYPEAFCSCSNCEQARKLGGKNLRKRSSLLINDDLLIDLGPDIMSAAQIHGISFSKVQYCIQTHPHWDHLDLSHFISRSPILGVMGAPCLHFYASNETIQRAAETFVRDLWGDSLLSIDLQKSLNMQVQSIQPLQTQAIGDYLITPFSANHALTMGAMVYAVESENRRFFYGTDTGPFFDETWQAFHDLKMKFDVVILDHTQGIKEPGVFHMNANQVMDHFTRMRSEGLLNPNARIFATHIAHDANPVYPELVNYASQNGYKIAYDGLTLEV